MLGNRTVVTDHWARRVGSLSHPLPPPCFRALSSANCQDELSLERFMCKWHARCGLCFAGPFAEHVWSLLGDGVGAEEQGRGHAQQSDGERVGKSCLRLLPWRCLRLSPQSSPSFHCFYSSFTECFLCKKKLKKHYINTCLL